MGHPRRREGPRLAPGSPGTHLNRHAATHAAAREPTDTDWTRIVSLYDLLVRAEPGPVTALNRAVAIAMRDGPAAGLALIDPLVEGPLATYRFAHAARADLLRRLGRDGEARDAYTRALELTEQASEQRFLGRRLRELSEQLVLLLPQAEKGDTS